MHLGIQSEGFSGSLATALTSAKLPTSRMPLIRSAIILSGKTTPAPLGFFWRAIYSWSSICNLLNADLTPTGYFSSCAASWKAMHSNFLGEVFSHWFSQRYLGISILAPYEFYQGSVLPVAGMATFPKAMPIGFRRSKKPLLKERPDFIGISGHERIVLEAKGRSGFSIGGVSKATILRARNKALHQVCRIASVDGLPPVSRVACVFAFSKGNTCGFVSDPPAIEANDLQPDYLRMVRDYYSIAFDPLFRGNLREEEGEFLGAQFIPGWSFSIHRKVLRLLDNLDGPESAFRLFATLKELQSRLSIDEVGDTGPDGFRLAPAIPYGERGVVVQV